MFTAASLALCYLERPKRCLRSMLICFLNPGNHSYPTTLGVGLAEAAAAGNLLTARIRALFAFPSAVDTAEATALGATGAAWMRAPLPPAVGDA